VANCAVRRAVFDYVCGQLRRAPRWVIEHGLEWLGRLIIEPRRLWKRYLIGNPVFLARVIKQRLGWLGFE
jgi:N-acetylglucosaminyldiphosphoundecaprenol N-acetyl-beta-D-mannosaminyltransferase